MDKFIEDLTSAVKDFRTYVLAAVIAYLGWASEQANVAIDEVQETINEVVAELQE